MGKNENYPIEEARQLLKDIEKNYLKFYDNSPSEIKIFKQKNANSGNDFWKQIGKDTTIFISEDFTYAGTSVNKIFNASKRSYDTEQIEYLKELPIFYETHIFNPETQNAILRDRDITDQENSTINEIDTYKKPVIKVKTQSQKITKNTTLSKNQDSSLLEILTPYYKKIHEEFRYLQLAIVGFKLQIEHYIQIPLLKNDKELKSRRYQLQNKLDILKNKKNIDEEQIKDISNQIYEIDFILNEKHDIFDVLKLGQDIFIEASAGSGKSTILKWLAYRLVNYNSLETVVVPIFIELKYYTDKVKSLNDLIKGTLREHDLILDNYSQYKLYLFLDGYDEYTKDSLILLKEIIGFKHTNPNSKIIFTGRREPNFADHNIDFVSYALSQFEKENIEELFKNYLGLSNGVFYFNKIEQRGILQYLQKPLFAIFILVLIKKKTKDDHFKLSDIESTIVNKGKLFTTLIVKEFIEKYESKFEVDKEKWKSQKELEIDCISRLAYHLTVTLKNKETISLSDAKSFLNLHLPADTHLNSEEIISEFRNHNILNLFNKELSFPKKEIRYFFASKSLIKKIHSLENFHAFKVDIESLDNGNDIWTNLMDYTYGVIKSDLLFDASLFPENINRVLITKEVLIQLELLLITIDQKNYPQDTTYINQKYIVRLITKMLSEYKTFNNQKINYVLQIWHFIVRHLIIKYPFLKTYIPDESIRKANCYFMAWNQGMSYLDHNNKWLVDRFKEHDLGMSISEIIELYPKVNPQYGTSQYYFDQILRADTQILFSQEEILYISYNYFFNLNGQHPYRKILNKGYVGRDFIIKRLEPYFSEFLIYFYNKNPQPNYVTYLRLLITLKEEIHRSYNVTAFSISAHIDIPDIVQEKLVNAIEYGCLHILNDGRKYTNSYLINIVENINYIPLKNRLSNQFMKVLLNDQAEDIVKIKACIYLIILGIEEQIKSLNSILKQNDELLKNIVSLGLGSFFKIASDYAKTHHKDYMPELCAKALSIENLNKEATLAIIQKIKITDDNLNNALLNLSLKETKYTYAVLSFFNNHLKNEQELVSYLTSYFGGYYGHICYYNLTKKNPKYYFDYKSFFKDEYFELKDILTSFKNDYQYPIEVIDIEKLLHIGDRKLLNDLNVIMMSNKHKEKLIKLELFDFLKSCLEEKVLDLESYQNSVNN